MYPQHIWATSWENLFLPYANNKGTDQPAHLRSLISAFVIRCLDSIISVELFYMQNLELLASLCSWADWFESYLVANPEDRFSRAEAHILMKKYGKLSLNGPGHMKMCLMPYVNNKGAGQPAHLRSLISTFVVPCLDSMMCILAISEVSRF